MEKLKKNKRGITLVALVVTIVILLILAGVSLNLVLSNNGIIKKSEEARDRYSNAGANEQEQLDTAEDDIDKMLGEDVSSLAKLRKAGIRVSEKTTVTDKFGNNVVIPAGFKIAEDSGTTVKDGIVIEDNDIAEGETRGNQFVWIPVSGIGEEGETTVPIKIDEATETTIILGRYTFDRSTGDKTLIQKGAEYSVTTLNAVDEGTVSAYVAGYCYYELNEKRESVQKNDSTATNTTAKDLAVFIQSVKDNHGYYMARYEASYGSGYNEDGGETVAEQIENAKPLSKVSTACSKISMSYTRGTLWNRINQGNAATVARNMYTNNLDANGNSVGVESDLVNSYTWDTAIVYIQEMGNTNYANANRSTTGNTNLKNTGSTGDIVCNIYDMAANESEWTTEYSASEEYGSGYPSPCAYRGGSFYDWYACSRCNCVPTYFNDQHSFRVVLYVID